MQCYYHKLQYLWWGLAKTPQYLWYLSWDRAICLISRYMLWYFTGLIGRRTTFRLRISKTEQEHPVGESVSHKVPIYYVFLYDKIVPRPLPPQMLTCFLSFSNAVHLCSKKTMLHFLILWTLQYSIVSLNSCMSKIAVWYGSNQIFFLPTCLRCYAILYIAIQSASTFPPVLEGLQSHRWSRLNQRHLPSFFFLDSWERGDGKLDLVTISAWTPLSETPQCTFSVRVGRVLRASHL